jgi:hypothetical protein
VQQDFDARVDILPVSDPNIFSMSQRVSLAQEQFKLANAAPQMHNMYEAYRRMYEALGVTNIDQLLSPPQDPQPIGPLQENSHVLAIPDGAPGPQAFPEQDHRAHISAHLAFMQAPLIQAQPALAAALQKHIFQHLSLLAQQIAQQEAAASGMVLPPEQMVNVVAVKEAELMQEFAQLMAPPQQPDPVVALKQQDLALRERELLANAQNDAAELQLDRAKLLQDANLAQDRIDSTEDIAARRAEVALYRTNLQAQLKARGQ